MRVDRRQARLIDALARLGFVVGGLGFVSVLAIITGFNVFNRLWLALLVAILLFTTGCWLTGLACARVSRPSPAAPASSAKKTAVAARRRPHELALLTLITLLFIGGYVATAYLAARSSAAIVATCVANFTRTLAANEQENGLGYLAPPVCRCISQRFLAKNGVIRLALFSSRWMSSTAYLAVTDVEQLACLNRFLKSAHPSSGVIPPTGTEDRRP